MHYYYTKYPYLHYSYRDTDGWPYIMFSIPPELLAWAYLFKIGVAPKTFFDCGAATGEIVLRALRAGMDARGIDIKRYPKQPPKFFDCGVSSQNMVLSMKNIKNQIDKNTEKSDELADLFNSGRIQIKSILNCKPITADLVFCNGTLTYFTESQLPKVLKKFHQCKMLCAIHNTTEDVNAARKMGYELTTCNKPRLIKPRDWWIKTMNKNGFNTEYNPYLQCFHAIPIQKR